MYSICTHVTIDFIQDNRKPVRVLDVNLDSNVTITEDTGDDDQVTIHWVARSSARFISLNIPDGVTYTVNIHTSSADW